MFYMNTALISVNIPSSITYNIIFLEVTLVIFKSFIDSSAFSNCPSLTQVLLINGLTVIGSDMLAMAGSSSYREVITIPSSITSIGNYLVSH